MSRYSLNRDNKKGSNNMTKKEFTNEQVREYLIDAVITTETYRIAVEILSRNNIILQEYGEKFIELSLDIERQIKERLEKHFEITEDNINRIKNDTMPQRTIARYLDDGFITSPTAVKSLYFELKISNRLMYILENHGHITGIKFIYRKITNPILDNILDYRKTLEPDNVALWEDRDRKEKLQSIRGKIRDYEDICEYLFSKNIITLWDFRCNLENIIPIDYLVRTTEEKIKVKTKTDLSFYVTGSYVSKDDKPNSILLSNFVNTANSLFDELEQLSKDRVIPNIDNLWLFMEDVISMQHSITAYLTNSEINQ